MLNLLKDLGLKTRVDSVYLKDKLKFFITKPGGAISVHVDEPTSPYNCWSIYYCLLNDSVFRWYECTEKVTTLNAEGKVFDKYKFESCKIVEECEVTGKLMLVRIDTPHNILSRSKDFRYAFSIRDTTKNMTWEQAIEFFKRWIV
jgi:hypothetical protein